MASHGAETSTLSPISSPVEGATLKIISTQDHDNQHPSTSGDQCYLLKIPTCTSNAKAKPFMMLVYKAKDEHTALVRLYFDCSRFIEDLADVSRGPSPQIELPTVS